MSSRRSSLLAASSSRITRDHLAREVHGELAALASPQKPLPLATVAQCCRVIVHEVAAALSEGETVKISRFGTLDTRSRPPQKARNPRTGESVLVGATRVAFFQPSAILRRKIDTPGTPARLPKHTTNTGGASISQAGDHTHD